MVSLFSVTSSPATAAPNSLNIMFYNVYNLFDNQKDHGKEDWTFLPTGYPRKKQACDAMRNPFYKQQCLETDWTTPHVKLKVSQLRKAVLGSARNGIPDILALCEVENDAIVKAFARTLGYDPRGAITTKSPDKRGIDVALVYRPSANLKYRSHREYKVPLGGALNRPTRNILEVEFIVGGKYQLFVYVNHWPSQGAKAPARVSAAKVVKMVVEKRLEQNPNAHILLTGDFNTIPADRPHPFHDVLMPSQDPNKQLFDVHTTFMRHPKIPGSIKKQVPPGTYFYTRNQTWNLLDRFFVTKSLFDGQGLDFAITSYRINNPRFLTRPWEIRDRSGRALKTVLIPLRGNFKTLNPEEAGYSDHFAIKGVLTFK